LVLVGGTAVVVAVAAALVAAGADRVEVVATLAFVPVFAAGLLAGRTLGWVTAAAATAVYLAARSADLDEAGLSGVAAVVVARGAAYAVAAWAGARAEGLVDRLSEANEWDDSPLVARGRALSQREPRRRSNGAWEEWDHGRVLGWTAPPDPDTWTAAAPRRQAAAQPPPPRPAAPAQDGPSPVDPETRLWTARYLCDRIAAEKAWCEQTGNPFSLVLVQVPDEPFAMLPYRRQVTLLRELGHQFVAGGVIDHLVHVPDQAQHWFAVVLPGIDRASAQVLERRLRTGIGGYLRSRGVPLPHLQSASLTAPDDDPALGEIWDALSGGAAPEPEPYPS
jgi:hypothetical protein